MKKFRSFKQKEESEKESPPKEKKSKSAFYITIFLGAIMVLSVFGVFFWNNENESDYSYGDYSFKYSNGMWTTKINGKNTVFYFMPQEVLNINASSSAMTLLKNSQGAAITFNPDENSSEKLQALDIFRMEMIKALASSSKQGGFAVTKNSSKYKFPILSCENSSYYFPVLMIDFENETSIRQNNDCIIAKASNEQDLIRELDYFRYILFGVIDEKESK